MEIIETRSGDTITIVLTGNVDEQGAEILKSRFQSLKTDTLKHVILDFSKVVHIGSAGIGKLLLLYKNIAIHGGEITISGLSSVLKSMFVHLKLDSVFRLE